MHDLGRALRKNAKRDEALVVYRALVPRIDLLGTASVRVSVLLEAAHVSMAAEGAGTAPPTIAELAKGKPAKPDATRPRTPPLDEAIAYLREARQRPATQLAGDVLLSLALTLDRAGSRDEADAVLAEAERAGAHVKGATLDYLAVSEDRAALEALASESSDRPLAQKAWEAYLAGPGGKGPWASAARTRLDLLKRGVSRSGRAAVRAAPAKPGKPR
jgi:hypothetical protein